MSTLAEAQAQASTVHKYTHSHTQAPVHARTSSATGKHGARTPAHPRTHLQQPKHTIPSTLFQAHFSKRTHLR